MNLRFKKDGFGTGKGYSYVKKEGKVSWESKVWLVRYGSQVIIGCVKSTSKKHSNPIMS